MQLLEDAYQAVSRYTSAEVNGSWRPGITDLFVYETIIGMHGAKEDLEDNWTDTPDHVMARIIDNNVMFNVDYGFEQMDEEIREYLINEGFIANSGDEE